MLTCGSRACLLHLEIPLPSQAQAQGEQQRLQLQESKEKDGKKEGAKADVGETTRHAFSHSLGVLMKSIESPFV